ncbi:MAG: glycosyltransferase family 2 protein, partial [Planctomycetales bacterium]|nr:glycosyltransferase family 2 protein [Planctomycetales bacterium]
WHRMINRTITSIANSLLGCQLTDIETCYKMFPLPVAKAVLPQLLEAGFGIEIELTAAFLSRGLTIAEVPISYSRRTYSEGKTIGWRDGIHAVWCIWKYRLRAIG